MNTTTPMKGSNMTIRSTLMTGPSGSGKQRHVQRAVETAQATVAAILRLLATDGSTPVRDLAAAASQRLVQAALHSLLAQGLVSISGGHVRLDRAHRTARAATSENAPSRSGGPPGT